MIIEEISKNFGGIKALDGCDIKIKKEKITAIIGPNGSGKTTLFNVISGLTRPDRGKIIFNGENIVEIEDFKIAKLGISRTFQEVRLFKNLTIEDHLKIALGEDDEYILKSLTKKEVNAGKIKEPLNLVGLDKDLDTYVTDLSFGQRKLLDLTVAIAKKHSILMLDEPVAGINPELRKKIKGILRDLRRKGETIILIEHDMNFVMDLADYVYVLDYGKVIAQGIPRQIQKNK